MYITNEPDIRQYQYLLYSEKYTIGIIKGGQLF